MEYNDKMNIKQLEQTKLTLTGKALLNTTISHNALLFTTLKLQLARRSAQFRAVQRRLLTKFKDKTPTPLANQDSLLEGTYKQIQVTDVITDNLKVSQYFQVFVYHNQVNTLFSTKCSLSFHFHYWSNI